MTSFAKAQVRFWAVVALLLLVALFLDRRSSAEPVATRLPVADFPASIGGWQSRKVELGPEVIAVLGNGEFLQRVYHRDTADGIIDFFLAYFPSQRTGSTIHSPKNCLPGAGWAPIESGTTELTWPNGRKFQVNQFVIGRGLDRQVALYWYQAHGRAVASEYWAKFYLVADAIRMNRSDGALVRVLTPVQRDETLEQSKVRAREFAHQVLPLLDQHVPH